MRTAMIPRPDFAYSRRGRAPLYPYDQILATLGTRRAVLIPLNGRRRDSVASAIGKTVRRRGFRFRHRHESGGLAVWVEHP